MTKDALARRELLEVEKMVIHNLSDLSIALGTAVNMRFMSVEHGKNIWKAYLQLSGMDIPKELAAKVK